MIKKQIMLVKNEAMIALELPPRLPELGYLVPALASCGEQAIKQAAALQPDLLLMDNPLRQDKQSLSEQRQIEQARFSSLHQRLQAAAEVSQQINAILKPEQIVPVATLLLREKFDLKHVQIYLFDEAKQELIYQPPSWQAMLKPTHIVSLSKEKSLLAHAARSQKACLLQDIKQSTEFIPEEPLTRSQMALPLIIGERLLGLLALQDLQPNRFVPADVDLFSTLAGQIAIALENARLSDQLKSLDRLKNEFLANITHELRTPLNSIIGYSELMLMGVNGALNRETTNDLHLIRHSGQQLLKLVNNIVDIIHLRSQKMVFEYESINLQVIFDEIQRECEPLLQHLPIKLELQIESLLPQIETDKQRLKQILMNIVENAIKFTKQGFIRLYAFTEEEFVVFAIEDTGSGIHQSQFNSIFEYFRQLDGSSTRTAQGCGLGLAITRHLVELHGGTIQVKSQFAQGSTFFVRLPIKQIAHTVQATY